ncbi:unnamed protein product [Urochloa decumbens]|uniref:Transcription factor CBF/NF-Y/archaeal histone domain-containing protein n=1 Tax=Urochloa decumbens TaxID=240449 RepID=A0ABC8V6S5_9POAL
MGRKAKRGEKKGGRDAGEEHAAPAAADSGSSDGEGGGGAAGATGLPMANLVRLMRGAIPEGVKVSTSAKHLTHDCAVEFVGFVAGEASEIASAQHRRTIAPEDFTSAFRTLGFDDYVEPMSTYIRRYRDHHDAAGGYGAGFVPRPPPAAAAEEAAAVAAPDDVPCISDEEMQYIRSMVLRGEYDGSSAASTATPAGHGYGYTGGHM